MPDSRIPALQQVGLEVVPGFTRLPDGTEDPEWRRRYFTWYEQVRDWRLGMQQQFVEDADFAQHVLDLCARDAAFFALCFLVVEEPRAMTYFDGNGLTLDEAYALLHSDSDDLGVGDEELGYQTIHPFIPFAYQVDAMRLCTRVILGPMRTFPHDILWDKARGVGMSYAILAWAYWGWLHIKGLRGTILTEKWDKAERTKDINSLFGKFDLFLDYTPDILIPEGFVWRGEKDSDRLLGRLINPENGAAIYTEPTTADATRSGREAYVAVDELNFHQYLKKTWSTIHGTAYHCLGWTTASRRYGRQGETIIAEGKKNPKQATVSTLEWWDNPHQDHIWFERERARFAAAGMAEEFEVEYLRNATAGAGRMVYIDQLETLGDSAWTKEGYDPTKPLCVAVDPAASDFTAWVFWQKHFRDEQKKIRWLEAVQLRNLPVQFWIHVMTTILPRDAWVDDKGIKHPADPMWKYLKEGFFDLPDIKRTMDFLARVPPGSLILYGDPSMAANTVTGDSWEAVFTKGTRELRAREYGADDPRAVSIQCRLPWKPLYTRNNYQDQRVGMREALTMSEFYAGSDGVLWFYDCLRNTMFQETTERSTRAPGHLHTDEYHVVSAGQYGMTWETMKLTPNEIDALYQKDIRDPRQPKALRRNLPVRAPSYRPKDRSLPAGVL